MPDIKTIRLWQREEFCQSENLLTNNFWEVGLESVELYEKMISGEDNVPW